MPIASIKSKTIPAAGLCLGLLPGMIVLHGPARAAEASGARSEPRRVLMLQSFSREFRPWSEYARSIKAELERQSPMPLDIQEHTLLAGRFNNPGPEEPFVGYLQSLYHGGMPDLVLTVGAPAARFVQRYRSKLFPE